jgi:alkylation response protein AidB-like acyl-CoA dehydrogenase
MIILENSARDVITTAREVASALARNAANVDENGGFPVASLEEIKRSKLMGLLIPRAYNGLGAGYAEMIEVARILAGSCLSTGMIWAMHCQQVATLIDHGSPELLSKVLPWIAEQGAFIASVTSEREKGGHLLTAYAPVKRIGEEILLVREAPVVTGGAYGDAFLITMRAGEESPPSEVALLFAERSQLDIQVRSGWMSLGVRGTDSVSMSLRGRLPADQLINPAGGFEHVAVSTMIPVGHIAWASAWLGAAQGVTSQMLDVWRDPQARKGQNLQSDLFTAHLARVRLQIDAVSAYLHQTLEEYEAWRETQCSGCVDPVPMRLNIHINNLKILASELLFTAVNELLQMSGLQFGYLRNNRVHLERTFRDLRSASLMYTNDRLLIANGKLTLLDHDLLQA